MSISLQQRAPLHLELPPQDVALIQDVIDALWLEQLFDFRRHCSFTVHPGARGVLNIRLDDTRGLRLQGTLHSGLRPFRTGMEAPVLQTVAADTQLNAEALVQQLQTAAWWQDGTGRFLHFFNLSRQQAQAAIAREPVIMKTVRQDPSDLLNWEVLSCLKDRPFHPLARAKEWDGDDADNVAAYLPTALTPFALVWIAVERTRLFGTTGDLGQPIAEALLEPAQLSRMGQIARERQADGPAWLWLPVHPWQWRWLQVRQAALVDGCLLLGDDFGHAAPTASLRSLAVPGRERLHVKLSLSVNTLGAIRTLPPRYLTNAAAAAACLDGLRAADAWLASHLLLCDETLWCAGHNGAQDDAGLIGNQGELACLIRRYPALPQRTLIPMAALPVRLADGTLPVFDHLLGSDAGAGEAWQLFDDIARLLIGTGLRCVANGVMPELHGQNIVLVCDNAQVKALLLRDHDTLRICPALMQQRGLAIPLYHIDRSTPNTLELPGVAQLLAYFQTLAIEVNLYAVLAALAHRYAESESSGWRLIRQAICVALDEVEMREQDRAEVRRLLLEEEQWPFKQVLAPLLARKDFSTGMPSSMGAIANPLLLEDD
jgi:siderophore synthetase component